MASAEPTSPERPPSPPIKPSSPRVYRYNVDGLSDLAQEQNQRFARDIEWKVVGPMPVDLFLEKFLPHTTKDIPPFEDVKFSGVPDTPRKESAIYSPLRDELNKVLKESNPKLAFFDTSNRPESPGKVGSSKPDLGMFHGDDVNRGNLESIHEPSETAPGGFAYTARMGEIYVFIEVKTSHDLDPFTDPPDGDIPPEYRFTIDTSQKYAGDRNKKSRYRVTALGQSTRYAHIVQTRQFRTCVYSISVAGTTARLLRWDRSGVIVTESFDFKSNPKILVGFVWRFSRATDEQRGFDRSAVGVATKENQEKNQKKFLDAIRGHVEEQLPGLSANDFKSEVHTHYGPGAITQLMVGTGSEARSFWVSRPMFTSKGVTGRSTRGYWGIECDSGNVVFVKDVWRTDIPGVQTEGEILDELLKAGVRNIPELARHGDVLHDGDAQTTKTDQFAKEDWVKSLHSTENRYRPIARKHYRLVTRVAGCRLSTFKGTKELLSATYDILIAVMDANSKAMTVHRDLSLGNIALFKTPGNLIRVGYLIDWELSCKTDKITTRNHVLTGTPAFMSIAVCNPKIAHVYSMKDDLESLFYVVLYCALLWLPVETTLGLEWWLGDFFCARDRAGAVGAITKHFNAFSRYFTQDLASTRSQAVLGWLNAAMDLHHHAAGGPNPAGPNPAWDDGQALKIMWEETLAKELPDDDWQENTIPDTILREAQALRATHTQTASTILHESHPTPPQQLPTATTPHEPPKRSPPASFDGDEPTDLFGRESKKQRRSSGREGGETELGVVSFPQVTVDKSYSPGASPTMSRKLQLTHSQKSMPPPTVAGPSRQTAGETGPTPTTAPTSNLAATPSRSTRKKSTATKNTTKKK